jgi:phosphate transport system substrate-binding protein
VNRSRAWATAIIAVLTIPARADTLVMQGSTTFNSLVLRPHQAQIEAIANHKLTIIPNKTSLGLLALMDGQADLAMISAPLETEIELLRKTSPDRPYERLRSSEVIRTRMAFAVHPSNPVRSIDIDSLRGILTGTTANWLAFGGANLSIRLILVRDGGGVQASVEHAVLDGKSINVPGAIRVQSGSQVVRIVEQDPGAIGLSQLEIVRRSDVAELSTPRNIEQPLSIVTLGEPTLKMLAVIDAIRRSAATVID